MYAHVSTCKNDKKNSLKKVFGFRKFIPGHFIVFEATVNGIVVPISFSVCSLLVCRKATDFYMLILCPATLLKELMISHSFFGRVFRVF
jgi:hypothetical protein